MKTKLAVMFIALVSLLMISCDMVINPQGFIVFSPDQVQYGNIYVYSKVNRDISISNMGFMDLIITDARIESGNSSTLPDEFSITSSPTCIGEKLSTGESFPLTVTFSPKSDGDKQAKLIIEYKSGNKNSYNELDLTGLAYSGSISVNPSLVNFPSSYVGEERLSQVTISNSDSKTITVTSIAVSNPGSATVLSEFQIVSGWSGSSFKLRKGESKVISLKFKPQSLGSKSANVVVDVAESYFDFYIYLKGEGCEQLEITTPNLLPNGQYLKYYSHLISCKGGDGNYSLIDINNDIPNKLTLTNDSINGVLEEYGDKTFTILAKDGAGHTVSKTFKLQIEYAKLIRDSTDSDIDYRFDVNNYTGSYNVNLICEGNIPLTVNSITLSGSGFISGEATFLTKPNLPLVMNNGDKIQIVIKVESLLDQARSVTLTVDHTGYNSQFKKEFMWRISNGQKFVFILAKNASMSSTCNLGCPIYDMNGNVIPYPSRWQAVQYLVSDAIKNNLNDDDTFDIIAFSTSVYFCFAQLKKATNGNKQTAIAWLWSQNPGGCDNSYDALKAAYTSYGNVDTVYFYSDGRPDTALSLGYGACSNPSIATKIITDMYVWIKPHIIANSSHKLNVIQFGGSPTTFMVQLGALPNAQFTLK